MARANRQVLVFAPLAHTYEELCRSAQQQTWLKLSTSGSSCVWSGRDLTVTAEMVSDAQQACALIMSSHYDLVVVDCRNAPHPGANRKLQERQLMAFLEAVRDERDLERRYPRRRIVVLVGDSDSDRLERLVFTLGRQHVGAFLKDSSLTLARASAEQAEARCRFFEELWRVWREMTVKRRPGHKALLTAGGGITGIYYELGVIKCLHEALDVDVRDFEIFSGISGGAVVASALANGFHVDDLIAKLGDMDKGWRYRLRLGLKHLNVGQVPRRVLLMQRELLRYLLRMLKREDDFRVATLLGTYTALLGPIFDNSEFERALRELFAQPGHSNDFRELERVLLIGATDQDRREHVLFGDKGMDHVPISRAVQASAAMHPFFPSVEIDGRFYTDGIVTRTSNLRTVIERGARLVFVVDPFVPLIADRPGYNARHGNMWIAEQDYKTMSFTRFEQARNEIIRQHPGVNVYTFVPSNRMRQLMSSQNPFVARNFHPIVCEAYRSTARRLRQLEYKIKPELASHGIGFSLDQVDERVLRLRRAEKADVRLVLEEIHSRTSAA